MEMQFDSSAGYIQVRGRVRVRVRIWVRIWIRTRLMIRFRVRNRIRVRLGSSAQMPARPPCTSIRVRYAGGVYARFGRDHRLRISEM